MKRGQLVCQHLENISRKALEDYQSIIKEFVKGQHGIYALYSKSGRLYYVGLASNLRNRLKTHLNDKHGDTWDRFSVYLTIDDSHLRELESLILKISKPKGNLQSGKFIRSQDLIPLFRRKISRAQKMELDNLFWEENRADKVKEVKRVNGRIPVLAPYFNKRTEIRYKYKDKIHKGIIRKNGTILLKGKIYNSPSVAGGSIAKHSVDGWIVWKYEAAPGKWVILDKLREK
ncbi:MAG: GIY-YIG nuclease family protein [candidate division FCPU426 bacterium]